MRTAIYALTLFVSAYLLFFVQPMAARIMLPSVGGGSGVWTVCLLFFQCLLLLGYLYSHLLVSYLQLRSQALVHSALLLTSLAIFAQRSNQGWPESSAGSPVMALLWYLLSTLGAPILVISSSAPLLQRWFASQGANSPYRLYAVSNLGSLLGLLSYPVLLEPWLGLQTQRTLWSFSFGIFVLLSLGSAALLVSHSRTASITRAAKRSNSPLGLRSTILWLALSGTGVLVLMSISAEITANLIPMPLLWVLPLALYLLTFILSFAAKTRYRRRLWVSLFSVSLLPTLWLPAIGSLVGPWSAVLLSVFCLFAACMVCHGELAARKPASEQLSLFYLVLALGGVLASASITFAAPALFVRNWELPISLFLVFALAGFCIASEATRGRFQAMHPLGLPRAQAPKLRSGLLWLWMAAGGAFAYLGTYPLRAQTGTIAAERSFYGQLRVVESHENDWPARHLVHGRIRHGSQWLDTMRASEPTLYYTRDSGIGIALEHYQSLGPMHVGVVGLGVGTVASYGTSGDRFRFYELDPLVVSFAKRYFHFLEDTAADATIIVGDGRLSLANELQRQGSQRFELLVIDAFTADAIPTHLLTREAFALYSAHLSPSGTLALHLTNDFLDLVPLAQVQAQHLGKASRVIRMEPSEESSSGSTWILITDNTALLDSLPEPPATGSYLNHCPLWTDDYSNIICALR